MSDDFPMYALSEEHRAIREAVRAVCDAKVAPHAAEVDASAQFPQAAYDALARRRLRGPAHRRGVRRRGADALATCLVIEEVARACAAVVADPQRQQARHHAAHPGGLGGAEEEVPLAGRRRHRDVLLLPVRARGRLGRRRDEDPRGARRRRLGAQRREALDHQRRRLRLLHGLRGHRPRRAASGISAFVVEKTDEGVTFGAPEKKLGIKGSPDPRGLPRQRAHPRRTG